MIILITTNTDNMHFEQFIEQKMVQFQDSILKHYTILPFPTCFPTWYLKPIVHEFYHVPALGWGLCLSLNQSPQPFDYLPQFYPQCFTWTTTSFNYKPPSMCFHTPSTLWIFTFYIAPMAINTWKLMIVEMSSSTKADTHDVPQWPFYIDWCV